MNAGRLGVGGAAHEDHLARSVPTASFMVNPLTVTSLPSRVPAPHDRRDHLRQIAPALLVTQAVTHQSKSACQRSGPKTSYWMSRGDTWRSISALRTACMNGKGPHR